MEQSDARAEWSAPELKSVPIRMTAGSGKQEVFSSELPFGFEFTAGLS